MDGAVVDTDVVSFLFKGDPKAELYRNDLVGKTLVISFMTLAELKRWAIEHSWGQNRRAKLELHVRNFVLHPFNVDICEKWAEITANSRKKGRTITCADAWIAATAVLLKVPLVTHNGNHFDHIEQLNVISRSL